MVLWGLMRGPETEALWWRAQGQCPKRAAQAKLATEQARRRVREGYERMCFEAAKTAEARRIAQRRKCIVPVASYNTKTGRGVPKPKRVSVTILQLA